MTIFFSERERSDDWKYVCCSQANKTLPTIGCFHAISGDTNNSGEMNKC